MELATTGSTDSRLVGLRLRARAPGSPAAALLDLRQREQDRLAEAAAVRDVCAAARQAVAALPATVAGRVEELAGVATELGLALARELVGAALDRDGAPPVPRQLARGQQCRDVAHALVHDGTKLRELPERPVVLQHEAKRARVCQVQESQRIVPRRLQRVRKAAECAPGQLPIEAEQRQCRVARVEGRLAARAGEEHRVARQRLAAHAATQGTRGLSLSGVRGHAGYAQDVCGEGRRA